MITDKQFSDVMNILYSESKKENADLKNILGKAVSFGMKYKEEQIKEGIDILFKAIHEENKK